MSNCEVIDITPHLKQQPKSEDIFNIPLEKLPWAQCVLDSEIPSIVASINNIRNDICPAAFLTSKTLKTKQELESFVESFNGLAARTDLTSYFNWYHINDNYGCEIFFYKYSCIGVLLAWHCNHADYPSESIAGLVMGLLCGESPEVLNDCYNNLEESENEV